VAYYGHGSFKRLAPRTQKIRRGILDGLCRRHGAKPLNLMQARHIARLALALLLYTAQRRSDVVLFGRQHVRNGKLQFTQQKNRRKSPVTLSIPVLPALQEIIDASPCGDLTFLVTEFGKGFTANGFGNRMRKWCDEAGLPLCSAHGLRKAAAARLAELGCTEEEIKAVTGHRTSKEVSRYTRGARQSVLAERAMGKLAASHFRGSGVYHCQKAG